MTADATPRKDAEAVHDPVLLAKVLTLLQPRAGGTYIDATANGGGHTRALLEACAPDGRVLALDRDTDLVERLKRGFDAEIAAGRLIVEAANFADMRYAAERHDCRHADGILFDLGLSSYHFDRSGRGFSFADDEPLDMRFDTETPSKRASEILSRTPLPELTDIIRRYGEERYASRIARTIIARRQHGSIATTRDLFAIVEQSLPAKVRWRAARHAARVFQAFRIAVNDELDAVERALPAAWDCLAPNGRIAVISFHSLEDRLVKRFFRGKAQIGEAALLTKKPTVPSEAEIARNSRAQSAKLRCAEKREPEIAPR